MLIFIGLLPFKFCYDQKCYMEVLKHGKETHPDRKRARCNRSSLLQFKFGNELIAYHFALSASKHFFFWPFLRLTCSQVHVLTWSLGEGCHISHIHL